MMSDISIAGLSQRPGEHVQLSGWISGVRSSGKIHFLLIRDGSGECQAIVEAAQADAFAAAAGVTLESSFRLKGEVRVDPRSPGGVEVHVTEFEVVQKAVDYPITRKEHGVDFLMNHRHLWLRSPRQVLILKIRATLIDAARGFFNERGFTLIDTPLFQPGAAEGAATLFGVNYYDQQVFLAQTGQLYLECAAMALGKVYCFGPTFRAEKSKTRRHLSEFWMLEPEVAFAELPDLECLAEDLVAHMVKAALTHHRDDLMKLGRDVSKLEQIQTPFPRVTYSEAVELLRSPALHERLHAELEADRARLSSMEEEAATLRAKLSAPIKAWEKEKIEAQWRELNDRIDEWRTELGNRPGHIAKAAAFEWGEDFGGDDETILSRQFSQPLIVTCYPKDIKAFYMKRHPTDDRVVLNLDVLAPEGYGEIIGGSQREDELDVLLARMQAEGMDTEPYSWYLDLRRYGSVPHGGFGLGMERTVAWICGLKHIRETIPFPRLSGRMYP